MTVVHEPFTDTPDEPRWWHATVPDEWHLPHVLGLEPVQDEALIEKEEEPGAH
jgi:hypothetical protein